MTDANAPLSESTATDAAPPPSNWGPTRTSVAVVVGCTAVLGALLVHATGLWKAAVPAAGGAATLALAVSLASARAYRPLARFAAACLLLPAGAGVVAGPGYALAKQLGGTYPVGSTFVVLGLGAAGFGGVAAVRGALERDALESALAVATAASLPATLAFVPLALLRLSAELTESLFLPVLVPDPVPPSAFPGALADGLVRFLVAPTHEGPHLLSFALVCYVAAVGLAAVLRTYPAADLLLPDDPEAAARVLDPLERAATLAATAGALVVLAAGVLFVAPGGFDALPRSVLAPLAALADVSVLRLLLLTGGVTGALLGLASLGIRRRADAATDGLGGSASPLAAGLAVVLGGVALHSPVLSALLDATLAVLPAGYAADVRTGADAVVTFYGGEVVVLGLSAGVLLVAAVSLALLYVAARVGVVADRAGGAAVAGAGLFVASAVAATVGVGTPLVLAGLVGGLVVRDAGAHGATLGFEVGRRGETRRAELVHLGAALCVGVVGAVAAVGLAGLLDRVPALDGGVLSVALGGAVVGVLCLVAALR